MAQMGQVFCEFFIFYNLFIFHKVFPKLCRLSLADWHTMGYNIKWIKNGAVRDLPPVTLNSASNRYMKGTIRSHENHSGTEARH